MTDEELRTSLERRLQPLEDPESIQLSSTTLRALIQDSRDLRELVAALPRCEEELSDIRCGKPSTRYSENPRGYSCDEHGFPSDLDTSWAPLIRRLGDG